MTVCKIADTCTLTTRIHACIQTYASTHTYTHTCTAYCIINTQVKTRQLHINLEVNRFDSNYKDLSLKVLWCSYKQPLANEPHWNYNYNNATWFNLPLNNIKINIFTNHRFLNRSVTVEIHPPMCLQIWQKTSWTSKYNLIISSKTTFMMLQTFPTDTNQSLAHQSVKLETWSSHWKTICNWGLNSHPAEILQELNFRMTHSRFQNCFLSETHLKLLQPLIIYYLLLEEDDVLKQLYIKRRLAEHTINRSKLRKRST